MKVGLDKLGKNYKVGKTVQFAGFTSTSSDIGVMNTFVGNSGERTLFLLDTQVQ